MHSASDNAIGLHEAKSYRSTRTLSAGSVSLAIHVVGFILLALLVPTAKDLPRSESERSVEIVLSRPSAQPHDEYQNRDESIAESTGEKSQDAAAAVTAPDLTQVAPLVSRELALPSGQPASPIGAISTPSLSGNQKQGGSIPLAGDAGAFIADEQAKLKAGRPRGDAANVSLFGGRAASGRSFIFLIDRSKSMGTEGLGALQAAEQELLVALRQLQPVHQFQVIAYHHQCVYLNQRKLLPATEENKNAVEGFLSGLAAFGATEHEMALQSALYHEPDVIYLLTDGGHPELSEGQIRKITKLASARTTIHCIQFGFGVLQSEDNFLSRLAAMNRGGFSYVDMSRRKQ